MAEKVAGADDAAIDLVLRAGTPSTPIWSSCGTTVRVCSWRGRSRSDETRGGVRQPVFVVAQPGLMGGLVPYRRTGGWRA